MSELIDPGGHRPSFDGAAWISQDGRYWWNGTAWQPIVSKRRPPYALIGAAIAIIAVIAIVIHSFPRSIIDTTTYGATNATIDSANEIEFDYRAQDSCGKLTFIYTFYNQQGIKVSEFEDQQSNEVTAGKSYHFTIYTSGGEQIDASAVRFTATPTCNS